jgi:hypothetical protein
MGKYNSTIKFYMQYSQCFLWSISLLPFSKVQNRLIFLFGLVLGTEATAESEFDSWGWVLHFDVAISAFAFWKLVDGDVFDLVGFSVAWIAEVRVAPAKPDSAVAAVFALVFDEIGAVDLAISDASANGGWHALGAEQCVFIYIIVKLCTFCTIFPSNKIRLLTLVALVV